jgi:predicted TIM-barrel fold metal-dependent hydrolase
MGAGSSVKHPSEDDRGKFEKSFQTWQSGRSKFYGWHNQTLEEVLEPEIEIVDPHHHLWDMRELNGYNLWGIFKQQYYMTDELVEDCVFGGHRVTHTVFMEAHSFQSKDLESMMAPLGEVQMAQGVAAQFASGKYGKVRCAAGIVGTADFEKYGAAVERLLTACKSASPNYCGVRCSAQHDTKVTDKFAVPEPGLYRKPKFREGFALLEKHGLVFDAFLFSSQLPDLYDLAKDFPGTTIVLDHLGTPVAALGNYGSASDYDGQQGQILEAWKFEMSRLAQDCPNVYVKIGGLLPQLGHGLEQRGQPATSTEIAEIYKDICMWTIRTFGADKCMFESNFPVDKVNVSYTVLWNAFKRITNDAGLSQEDRRQLFSETAKRVYRLS